MDKFSFPHSLSLPLLAVNLLLGICMAHYSAWIPLGIALLLWAWVIFKKNYLLGFLAAFLFCIGFIRLHQTMQPIMPFSNLKNVCCQAKVMNKAFLDGKLSRFKTLVFVERFYYEGAWFEAGFPLYIYSQHKNYCRVDDEIICGPLDIKRAEDDFSFYLQKEGVGASVFCETLPYEKLDRPYYSWRNWLFWQRELLQIKLFKKMNTQTFGLFSSLFMGNKQSVSSKLDLYKNDFKLWGISHYLARSGLHLIIFILIWNYLFNLLPLAFRLKHLLILSLTLLYMTFSWSSISFLRAVGIYLLYKTGVILNLRSKPIHILSLICILFLLYNPLYLFGLDFQLSFLLSFCLLWIADTMHEKKIWLKSVAPTDT